MCVFVCTKDTHRILLVPTKRSDRAALGRRAAVRPKVLGKRLWHGCADSSQRPACEQMEGKKASGGICTQIDLVFTNYESIASDTGGPRLVDRV